MVVVGFTNLSAVLWPEVDHEYWCMNIGWRDNKREALKDHCQCHFRLDHGKILTNTDRRAHAKGSVCTEVIPPAAISKSPWIELISVSAPDAGVMVNVDDGEFKLCAGRDVKFA